MYGTPPQIWENQFPPGATAVNVTPVPPSACIGSTDSRLLPTNVISFVTICNSNLNSFISPQTYTSIFIGL